MSVSIVNSTTSKQAEKLAEIGAQFKRVREDKELSIPHLTATTLIAEKYLRAIENGEIASLPEPIYVRGFIRKYGTALGVGDLSEDFPLNPVLPERKWSGSAAAELRPFHLYALYILVIAGAVSILATFLNAPEANKINDNQTNFGKSAQIDANLSANPALEPNIAALAPKVGGLQVLRQQSSTGIAIPNSNVTATPIANPAVTVSQAPLNKMQSEAVFGEVNSLVGSKIQAWATGASLMLSPAIASDSNFEFVGNKPVNVGIVMQGQSWLLITVDGQTAFEGVLEEGKKLTWSADKQISVRAGNASSVALSYNNQAIRVLGREGEVVEQLFGATQTSNLEATRTLR
ncbi:MAG: hypothetical protein AUK48_02195 [Oscillatoriales cyanobacterium CG2_30_44_21]|nr:MAG: hypothetical protein AUK48_02195 [Oscillatoriales cyanobacterium CG2_30_44_21]